ncbi:MAG: HNH endonuclease [Thermodesulfovibrionales bacterium]
MKIKFKFDKCILCLKNPADSWEHVIPQSLGGRLEACLLCTDCNNKFGSKFVSKLRSDPSIRIATDNLKDELPDLYKSAQDRLPFVGKADDGSIIKMSRKGNAWHTLSGPGANGSFIQDTNDTKKNIKRSLTKQCLSTQEISRWMQIFESVEEDKQVIFPAGTAIIKRKIPPLIPDLSLGHVSEQVPALIAYEFLALLINSSIYDNKYSELREYIKTGTCSKRFVVQRLSSGKYAPAHMIDIQPDKTHFTIFIRFFRWLVFAVKFDKFAYSADTPIYIEDLKQKQSLIAPSRLLAENDKWHIF